MFCLWLYNITGLPLFFSVASLTMGKHNIVLNDIGKIGRYIITGGNTARTTWDLTGTLAAAPVKFQSNAIITTASPPASMLHQILLLDIWTIGEYKLPLLVHHSCGMQQLTSLIILVMIKIKCLKDKDLSLLKRLGFFAINVECCRLLISSYNHRLIRHCHSVITCNLRRLRLITYITRERNDTRKVLLLFREFFNHIYHLRTKRCKAGFITKRDIW